MANYRPYPKQAEFHALGRTKRERVLLAGNQEGKTYSASMEAAYHATGLYPEDWNGRRFTRPTRAWVGNTTLELVRDGPQKLMLGSLVEIGSGSIPRACIHEKPTMSRGFPDLVDYILVKHVSGGISTVKFKCYDQGRKRWQTETVDWIWMDEEPPPEIYSEALARISATGGMVFMTMTPLLGMSEVVSHFYPEPDTEDRGMVLMGIDDALHIDPAERDMIISGYPEHEREARAQGIPMLGSGKIFAVPQSSVECEPFETPHHWPVLGGMDFGFGDHPTAAVRIAYDREADCVYLTHTYKEKAPNVPVHASALKAWGEQLRFAWPHDGHREWGDSGPIANQYRREGLKMLPEHATFPEGGYSTEAAVALLLTRMQTGRFKGFSHLGEFWNEVSMYHRKDGKIVKKRDDILSALLKALMMLRHARTQFLGREQETMVESEFDPFDFQQEAV